MDNRMGGCVSQVQCGIGRVLFAVFLANPPSLCFFWLRKPSREQLFPFHVQIRSGEQVPVRTTVATWRDPRNYSEHVLSCLFRVGTL